MSLASAGGIEASGRKLFAFDFDYTLVDDNTDTWIMSICPELQLRENLRHNRQHFDCWTDLMDHTFSVINEVGQKTENEILTHIGQLKLHDQALKAVQHIHEQDNTDSIILSDSNTVFISHILKECGYQSHL